MLGAMLGASPQCICVPESQFIMDALQGAQFSLEQVEPALVFETWRQHHRFGTWGLSHEVIQNLRQDKPMPYGDIVRQFVYAYGKTHNKTHTPYWVDHTPWNIKHVNTLFAIFPNAKMLHLVRDGRSVAASLLKVAWGPNTMDKAAYFWLTNLAYGLAAESCFGPERILRVHYEQLVLEPEVTLRRICDFSGLAYTAEMCVGSSYELPQFTQKQHALVCKAPDASRIAAWQTQLSQRQVEIFETVAGGVLESLGYMPQYGIRAQNLTFWERAVSTLKLFQMFISNWSAEWQIARSHHT